MKIKYEVGDRVGGRVAVLGYVEGTVTWITERGIVGVKIRDTEEANTVEAWHELFRKIVPPPALNEDEDEVMSILDNYESLYKSYCYPAKSPGGFTTRIKGLLQENREWFRSQGVDMRRVSAIRLARYIWANEKGVNQYAEA